MENEEIDKLLEKPIESTNDQDNVNFYTYEKLQIKSKIKISFSKLKEKVS